ncbi:MAG: DUF5916 domain-containing protein [Bacteroidota bacterium]
MLARLALILLLVGFSKGALAQSITIKATNTKIVPDGVIEEAWYEADSAYDFMQYFPYDTSLAVSQTVARVLYDDQFIYVLGIMQNQSADRTYITPSLRRDFRGEANDSFSILLDCFQDKTNGFLFGINPFGVRREVLITNGGSGRDAFNPDWDNKWFGEAKQYGDYWVAEMAIPFKTLRFAENADSWNVNFYRIDSEFAERSTWSPIERNFSIVNMATMREMKWDRPTGKPGTNISVIPYVAANTVRDFEEGLPRESNVDVGFDLKYAVTPGLNLDLTVNPDFSQVEVDQQVTNLDRFEIFFPERRQFFLENADLFSGYGNFSTRPFFSRRIGVAQDTATGQNFQNPIPFGARLSGKLNDDLRLGFLSMQTGRDDQNGLPSYNYTVLSLQQKVFDRSNVNFLVVNKQTFDDSEAFDHDEFSQYNRTVGADFNLATANNRWNGKAFVHHTFEEFQPDAAYAAGLTLEYSDLKWSSRVFSQVVGEGYNPEAGFVRRTDIRQLATTTRYSWYPERGGVQSHGPGFDFDLVGNSTYGFLDWDYNFLYDIRWRSTARFSMRLRQQYTYLFDPFDPSGSDGEELPADTDYVNKQIIASYTSDQRKKFFFELRTRSGEYFNGHRLNLAGSVGYRYQPFGFTSIDFTLNRILLPSPYTTTNLILIGPRFDFTFSKSIFFTTFVQYNSQIDNLNINSRLQWRFKPVSDIFLVYTDNYFAYNEGTRFIRFGGPRVRAVTFKITYWLNL